MTLIQNPTLADRQAGNNFAANLATLRQTQDEIVAWVADQSLELEWVLGRDRTLTALDASGRWLAGCSLPRRAADSILAKLEVRGAVACFLAPSHAAQIRSALAKLSAEQAIIAIVPEMRDLACMLHCEDFSGDLAGHRLWFVAGPAWEDGLRRLLEKQIGLAIPSQFIRTGELEADTAQLLIETAQQVFSEASAARSVAMQSAKQQFDAVAASPSCPRICVVAPSRFRLWNDLGEAMLGTFRGREQIEAVHFDADDPACSSPLALVNAARNCHAIFTANTGRADLPGLLSEAIPWVTWVSGGRIPSGAMAGLDDHLILADAGLRQAATESGWPGSRIHVGTWPTRSATTSRQRTGTTPSLAMLVDTVSVKTPEDLTDYSSHALLWETIAQELERDPFVLDEVHGYLASRMRRFGIAEEAFAHARFVEKLILPAYQQAIAKALVKAKAPIKLYGQGWDSLPEFAPYAAGAVHTREQFNEAVGSCTGLIHVWPGAKAHPVEAAGAPVVRRGQNIKTLLSHAKAVLDGRADYCRDDAQSPQLSLELIRDILRAR